MYIILNIRLYTTVKYRHGYLPRRLQAACGQKRSAGCSGCASMGGDGVYTAYREPISHNKQQRN